MRGLLGKTDGLGVLRPPAGLWEKLVTLAGGPGSAVVCLNKNDGSEIWKSTTAKEVCYAPPVPLETSTGLQLIYASDEHIYGLDIETGKQKWAIKFPETPVQRPAVTIMTPQIHENIVVVSNFYNGSIAIQVSADGKSAKKLWASDPRDRNHKKGLNILMASPIIRDGHVYGFAGKGEFRSLDLRTGEQKWQDLTAARSVRDSYFATAFITPHQGRFFIFNDQGELLIARFDPKGFEEVSRAKIIEPSTFVRGRNIVWSHPAYANRCLFVRNSKELICVDLSAVNRAASQ